MQGIETDHSQHPAQQLTLLQPRFHLVRVQVRDNGAVKQPLDRAWQTQQPDPAAVDRHVREGGDLGYVPASLDWLVLDVDSGLETSADIIEAVGREPAAMTTSYRGRGHHLAYPLPTNWSHPAGRGKGRFRLGRAIGDWLHDRAFSLETWAAWDTVADADLTAPALDAVVVDSIVAPPPRERDRQAQNTAKQQPNLQGDGLLPRGYRWTGLRYRLAREGWRIVHTEGEPPTADRLLRLADAINRASCRPWLPEREAARLARDVADWIGKRVERGDSASFLERQAWRGRRSGAARRRQRDQRLEQARVLFDAGATTAAVAAALRVTARTARTYRATLDESRK